MFVEQTHGSAEHVAHAGNMHVESAKNAMIPATEKSLIRTIRIQARPWRLSVDGTRAVLDLVIVGVGYLL